METYKSTASLTIAVPQSSTAANTLPEISSHRTRKTSRQHDNEKNCVLPLPPVPSSQISGSMEDNSSIFSTPTFSFDEYTDNGMSISGNSSVIKTPLRSSATSSILSSHLDSGYLTPDTHASSWTPNSMESPDKKMSNAKKMKSISPPSRDVSIFPDIKPSRHLNNAQLFAEGNKLLLINLLR